MGEVVFLWSIGVDGRVGDCKVLRSSGEKAFERAGCRAPRRQELRAARDEKQVICLMLISLVFKFDGNITLNNSLCFVLMKPLRSFSFLSRVSSFSYLVSASEFPLPSFRFPASAFKLFVPRFSFLASAS